METSAWHTLSADEVAHQLRADLENGIASAEVVRRQQRFGPNELVETAGRGPWQILWEQFRSAMIALLAVAALVSLYLHEYVDAAAIVAIIAINAALGFFQDYRAEKALAALKRIAVPKVKVRRDGRAREIPAKELVPGDVVSLSVGNVIPADGRVLESANLRVEEASLTGESEPVEKHANRLPPRPLPLGDRQNMVYMGTVATYGHGLAVVTETGMNTQLGRIAHSLQTVVPKPTPLQLRLAQLGRTLAVVSLGIVAIVFALGILAGHDARLMLMTALSLAVAIVPEGLPAVATVALAIGARRMFQRNALIRKLPAVETLGSVAVICSDKTGTLTQNRMTVTVLEVAGRKWEFDDSLGHARELTSGDQDGHPLSFDEISRRSSVALLLAGAGLCNDAELFEGEDTGNFRAVGEPTEAALVVIAARLGFAQPELTATFPRIEEVPFDSQRKRMTTVHRVDSGRIDRLDLPGERNIRAVLASLAGASHVAFMKGAVDAVLSTCQFAWIDDQAQPLGDDIRKRILEANDQLARGGTRVLGVAVRSLQDPPTDDVERDMVFVGLLGMLDPPRPEVKQAVDRCRTAGIRPIMITGDHPLTARHIAGDLGINNSHVLVGDELAGMSVADLQQVLQTASVFARVAPADKLRIVQALQKSGHIVAMTGDGVNDAPALKQAHIGVAMGEIGTDVSKEAAEMVLLDDNFATIVNAVEEGRIVYDNIRKFVKYTMTSNAGEVWVMVLGPLLGMPLPLLPLQILWVNLVTDGLPGLALAVEHAERETMQRPPYPPDEHIMGRGMWRDIAWVGVLMGVVSLALGYWYWAVGSTSEAHWRTIVFTVLTMSQMGNALAIRSTRHSLFQVGLLSNRMMLGSVLLTFLLQMAVVYLPPLQQVFKTTSLSPVELVLCLLVSTVVFWAVELQKLVSRMQTPADRDELS